MRKNLRFSFFAFPLLLLVATASGQTDRFAYVITDVNQEGSNWSYLRKVDLQTGAYGDVILNGNDARPLAYDFATKKQLAEPFKDPRFGIVANAAFGTGVAAIAYDRKNDRLYYTPMFVNQLRYVDLKTMKVFFVDGSSLDDKDQKQSDQSNIMTRMAFASDGNGYALSNDGNQLVRFTTGKNITVTQLGALVDDPANTAASIHNSCTSYGGDMIADDDGNLYVFSARNHVFKINIDTKVATHLGSISGLPATFTTNGAAVNDKNQVVIASAVDNSALYTVDFKNWTATPIKADMPWRSADLATSNLLVARTIIAPPDLIAATDEIPDSRLSIYPNPVTNKQFVVQFNELEGNFTIQVTDVMGRQSGQSIVNSKGKGQVEAIQLPASTLPGVYLVKVLDHTNKTVLSRKIVVQ